jgi:hypothetical protein
MPRPIKYDESPFEKIEFSGKIFMYSTPGWNVLYPIVDLIRLLKKNTIISTRNGKGQQLIRTYGMQYYHRVLNDDLLLKNEYQNIFKTIKCAFIFTDSSDPIATNIIKTCESLQIPIVCYSNLDQVYHFNKEQLKTAEEVIDKMYLTFDLVEAKKISDLFPEFEILSSEEIVNPTLDQCCEIFKNASLTEKKKKDLKNVKLFDPNLARIKKMERDRIKVDYPDDLEKHNKINVFSNVFSNIFKTVKKNNS